jgi:hypothetical protein
MKTPLRLAIGWGLLLSRLIELGNTPHSDDENIKQFEWKMPLQ